MPFLNAISYYVPEDILSNERLNELFPEWSVDKISLKTGIKNRRIAAKDEFASTMAASAAKRLFEEHGIEPGKIDFVLLCTQSPDYLLPTTACLIQEALGIPTHAGAMDFNLGCSGYVYGLSVAKGLISSGDADNILLLTSEMYSRHLNESDKSVRTIFGDAASASFITREGSGARIGHTIFGTDGKGAVDLIAKKGGMKEMSGETTADLYMNGPNVFAFTLKRVPEVVQAVLEKNDMSKKDIDLFVFHQANKYMLEHLRVKMDIPEEQFFVCIEEFGNTVSSTIPIALSEASRQGRLKAGMNVLLSGFGVGYSWGATILNY